MKKTEKIKKKKHNGHKYLPSCLCAMCKRTTEMVLKNSDSIKTLLNITPVIASDEEPNINLEELISVEREKAISEYKLSINDFTIEKYLDSEDGKKLVIKIREEGINIFKNSEAFKIIIDTGIKKYIDTMPKEKILFTIKDSIFDLLNEKLSIIKEKIVFENYSEFVDKLINEALTHYLKTL